MSGLPHRTAVIGQLAALAAKEVPEQVNNMMLEEQMLQPGTYAEPVLEL